MIGGENLSIRLTISALLLGLASAGLAGRIAYDSDTKDKTREISKQNFAPGELLIRFREGAESEEVMEQLGIQAKGASGKARQISRILNTKPLVRRYKKAHKLHKDSQGQYEFMGRKYRRIEDIDEGVFFKEAYKSLSVREKKLFRWHKIRLTDKTADLAQLIQTLKGHPDIESVQLNHINSFQAIPNDPYYHSAGSWGQGYDDLWGLKAINVEKAWDITQGEDVIVAVVDSGVDYNHPDIFDNIWVNPGEVEDRNGDGRIDLHDIDIDGDKKISKEEMDAASDGEDDDGNGLTDDLLGWDYGTSRDENGDGDFDDTEDIRDNDPMDGEGHGTHVAGTIAAVGNNNQGIIGVAPGAKIMIVKAGPQPLDEYLISSLYYAGHNGAKVINNSWGPMSPRPSSPALEDVIDHIVDDHNCVVVFSAGNHGTNVSNFSPANYSKTIAVAAVDHNDGYAKFSNWGDLIDVSAPGGTYGDVNGTAPGERDFINILSLRAKDTDLYCGPEDPESICGELIVNDDYYRIIGTSMAAPHVSGLAALLVSRYPQMSQEEIKWRIRLGGDDLGEQGFDAAYGWGRINCYNSLILEPSPVITCSSHTFSEAEGDGDGIIEPGEKGSLAVTLSNGWKDASSAAVVLSTGNGHITITNAASFLGNIYSHQQVETTFVFTIDSGYSPYYSEAEFALSVTSNAGAYHTEIPFSLNIPQIQHTLLEAASYILDTAIATDGLGHVYAVYIQTEAYNIMPKLYVKYSHDFGQTWQNETNRIDHSNTETIVRSPQLVCDNQGHVSVFWTGQERMSGVRNLYFNYSSDFGRTWQEQDTMVNNGSLGERGLGIELDADDSGGVYVIWKQEEWIEYIDNTEKRNDIYFNYSHDYGKTWQNQDIRISTSPILSTENTDIRLTVNARGDVYIGWLRIHSEPNSVDVNSMDFYLNYSADRGSTWLDEEKKITAEETPERDYLQLECDDNGGVYAMWEEKSGISFSSSSDSGGNWRKPIHFAPIVPDFNDLLRPQMIVSGSGNILFLCKAEGESRQLILFQKSPDRGLSWEPRQIIGDPERFEGMVRPKLTVTADGMTAIVWYNTYSGRERMKYRGVSCTYSSDFGTSWLAQPFPVDKYLGLSGIASDMFGHFYLLTGAYSQHEDQLEQHIYATTLSLPPHIIRGGLRFAGFNIIERNRISRTIFRYVLSLSLTNTTDSAITGIDIKLDSSSNQAVNVIDDEISIPKIDSLSTIDSNAFGDYFSIEVDRSEPIGPAGLMWQVDYTTTNGSETQTIRAELPAGIYGPASDLTGEGAIDTDDLLIMVRDWLERNSIADIYPPPPISDDIVNFLDFAELAESWQDAGR